MAEFPKSIFKNKTPQLILEAMDKHLKEIRIEANRQKTESARIKILKQSENLNHERNQFAKKIQANKLIKLKNLSLKGRGGGGSMKMPQEYAKTSLFRKN